MSMENRGDDVCIRLFIKHFFLRPIAEVKKYDLVNHKYFMNSARHHAFTLQLNFDIHRVRSMPIDGLLYIYRYICNIYTYISKYPKKYLK